MISLDTNVLVRLLVEDDEDQVARARALLRRCLDADERCLVTIVVLCELHWVLQRLYRVPRDEIATAIESFLLDDLYLLEESASVGKALIRYRKGDADFADYLIGLRSRSLGAVKTYTFDKALAEEEGFSPL